MLHENKLENGFMTDMCSLGVWVSVGCVCVCSDGGGGGNESIWFTDGKVTKFRFGWFGYWAAGLTWNNWLDRHKPNPATNRLQSECYPILILIKLSFWFSSLIILWLTKNVFIRRYGVM